MFNRRGGVESAAAAKLKGGKAVCGLATQRRRLMCIMHLCGQFGHFTRNDGHAFGVPVVTHAFPHIIKCFTYSIVLSHPHPQPFLIKSPQRAAHRSRERFIDLGNLRDMTWNHWGDQQHWSDWENVTWGQSSSWKNPEGNNRFANVSTLGLKQPLPLEDRRELVLGLLNKLQDEVQDVASGNFRITVASWGPVLIHAVLFYLCRARPSMPLRTLYNGDRKFTIEDATKMLWTEHNSLFPSVAEKADVLGLLSRVRFGHHEALLEIAIQHGFDPGELEGKVGAGPAPGNPGNAGNAAGMVRGSPLPSPARKRSLERLGTDEEALQLEKRKKILELRKQVANAEAAFRTAVENSRQRDDV